MKKIIALLLMLALLCMLSFALVSCDDEEPEDEGNNPSGPVIGPGTDGGNTDNGVTETPLIPLDPDFFG
ncbi:MAG: hypothetical protein IJD51_02715 [Clostridia bacterium]|nr:hypothetical protein [Clostridia bacterium]